MKNIGILTLSSSDNCGSLLQTYALKNMLEEKSGQKVEVINFTTELSHQMYDIFPKKIWKHPRTLYFQIKNYFKLKKSKSDYKEFRACFLDIDDKKEIFPEEINELKQKYDLLFVGSDQVWNVNMADFDNAFFAGWAECRKVAYAPSLGGHDLEEASNYDQLKKWLKDFSAVSVRETKGKDSLERALQKEVKLVLDPTLTINAEKWKDLIGPRMVTEKYIFYYSWAYCEEELKRIVQQESERLGYPVYVVDPRKWVRRSEKKYGFRLSKKYGPLAFLNLMYYSERNFVESFHGAIFSYLLKKDFWLLDDNEKFECMNTRLIEILKQLKMENRVLTPYNITKIDLDAKIDFFINEDLEGLRRDSLRFIEDNIKCRLV